MWRLKDEKITASIKWNLMWIIHGTHKGGVWKLCLADKFWLLKHFNDEQLLTKKSEFRQESADTKINSSEINGKGVVVLFVFILLYHFSFQN